jgi:hypothetical protein
LIEYVLFSMIFEVVFIMAHLGSLFRGEFFNNRPRTGIACGF